MAFGMEVNPRKLRSLHMFCLVATASLVRAETLPESEECSLRCEDGGRAQRDSGEDMLS